MRRSWCYMLCEYGDLASVRGQHTCSQKLVQSNILSGELISFLVRPRKACQEEPEKLLL